MKKRRILLMNASPNPKGNTQQILDSAIIALEGMPDVEIMTCSFAGKQLLSLDQCTDGCFDDFEMMADMWQDADGIILGAPVYT